MSELPTLTKRQLQAQVIGPIYAEMVEQLGKQRAGEILDSAIKKAAAGRRYIYGRFYKAL
jgi:hypothetical protein